MPSFSDLHLIFANITQIVAVPLRNDVPSPLAPRNDDEDIEGKGDETGEGEDTKREKRGKKGKEEDDEEEDDDGPEPVLIDLEGFESRIVVLPAKPGNCGNLRAVSGKAVYLRLPRTGTTDEPFGANTGDIVLYDLEEREEQVAIGEADSFECAAGGDKILVHHGEVYAIADLMPDQTLDKQLAVGNLETIVDPPAEWRQIFTDAWRLERDFFYDPGMHGVDWPQMRQRSGSPRPRMAGSVMSKVLNDPLSMERGADPQLDRGIEEVLKLLVADPHERPERPPYPDRSGM